MITSFRSTTLDYSSSPISAHTSSGPGGLRAEGTLRTRSQAYALPELWSALGNHW